MNCPIDQLADIVFDGSGRGARWMCQLCGRTYRYDYTPVPDLTPEERVEDLAVWRAMGWTDEMLATITIPSQPPCGSEIRH